MTLAFLFHFIYREEEIFIDGSDSIFDTDNKPIDLNQFKENMKRKLISSTLNMTTTPIPGNNSLLASNTAANTLVNSSNNFNNTTISNSMSYTGGELEGTTNAPSGGLTHSNSNRAVRVSTPDKGASRTGIGMKSENLGQHRNLSAALSRK